MGRLIDEDDVISAIYKRIDNLQTHEAFKRKHGDIDLLGLVPMIKAIQTPQPKIGKWIAEDDMTIRGRCSICGWEAIYYETDVFGMDYCPNCGAKMEEANEID